MQLPYSVDSSNKISVDTHLLLNRPVPVNYAKSVFEEITYSNDNNAGEEAYNLDTSIDAVQPESIYKWLKEKQQGSDNICLTFTSTDPITVRKALCNIIIALVGVKTDAMWEQTFCARVPPTVRVRMEPATEHPMRLVQHIFTTGPNVFTLSEVMHLLNLYEAQTRYVS